MIGRTLGHHPAGESPVVQAATFIPLTVVPSPREIALNSFRDTGGRSRTDVRQHERQAVMAVINVTNVANEGLVRQWIEEKQQVEVMLAWELLEVFNTSPLLMAPLREMASMALEEMRLLDQRSPMARAAIQKAWNSNKDFMALCKGKPGLNAISPGTLDAQECSDLIRLYGEFVENAGQARVQELKGGARGNWGGYDPELPDVLRQSHRVDFGGGQGQIWNKDTPGTTGRHRTKVEKGHQQGQSLVQAFLISQAGGIAGNQLLPSSTIHRIDRVFGLVPAADISGTTADSIYFLRRFADATLDPVFNLLPVATIVAGAHHSLLEVALVLSQNGIIDYSIGFYTTLFPAGGRRGERKLKEALLAAENHPKNHHILAYYSPGNGTLGAPAGCFVFEGALQMSAFRQFAKATTIERLFRTIPFCPNERQVSQILPPC